MRFILILFLTSFFSFAQERTIDANVEVDNYGNLYVNQTISNLDVNKDTVIVSGQLLIHKDQASLIGGVRLGKVNYTQYIPKKNTYSYVVNLPKGKTDSYRKTKDFFLATISYLATAKQDFGIKKKFNLEAVLPKEFTLIYPNENDLKETYIYPPPIIAGDFYNSKIEGFDVYNLNRFKKNKDKVADIISIIDEAYNFYLQNYPEPKTKPKIIFVPFVSKTLLGKTLDNVILLNSKMLAEKARLEKRLLSHEVAHLFWGVSGLRFKESVLTEGIAEYMSIKYLESIEDDSYLKGLLNRKRYRSEGVRDVNVVAGKIKKEDRKMISYDFSPLLFLDNEKKNSNIYSDLSDFYKLNITSTNTVSLNNLQEFLKLKNLSLIEKGALPDYFITETENKLIVKGFTNEETKVDVEKVLIDGSKETHSLTFSDKDEKYTFTKHNLEKITLDPDYKILQFSRLNDVWDKNETSYSSKNRYFNLEDVNPKVLVISNKILSYLETKDDYLLQNLTCEANAWLINSYKELKEEIYKNEADSITITGAVTYNKKGSKSMFIKMVYFSKAENKSKLIYLQLYLDKELKHVQKLKILKPTK